MSGESWDSQPNIMTASMEGVAMILLSETEHIGASGLSHRIVSDVGGGHVLEQRGGIARVVMRWKIK
jgi:hypothetical protein